MRHAWGVAATVASLALSGCASDAPRTTTFQGASVFPTAIAEPTDPSKPFDEVTCKADAFGKTRCQVKVLAKMRGSVCEAKAPDIVFDKPSRTFVVAWVPSDEQQRPAEEFRFCPLLGDGAFLKNTNGSDDDQFDDAWSGDDAGVGSDPVKFKGRDCYKRFRMQAENSKSKATYDYRMTFRHKSNGAVCTVDPVFKNG